MQKILLLIIGFAFINSVSAQFSVGSDGMTIASGEIFSYDGLALTPSSAYTLSSTVLEKADAYTITPAPLNPYIKRYFSFSNTAPAYSGSIRFSYSGADLQVSNGSTTPVAVSESDLRLNISDASAWRATSDLPVTGSGNEYITSSVSSQSLKFLTLASVNAALPVTWLSVEATLLGGGVQVAWKTATELNTQDFVLQHSLDARRWRDVGMLPAAGNTVTERSYSLFHPQPGTGWNYYRILQRDLDGRSMLSKIVKVEVVIGEGKIYPNPTSGKLATIRLPRAETVSVYDAAGSKVWEKAMEEGIHAVNFSSLKAGVYVVRIGNAPSQFVWIQ